MLTLFEEFSQKCLELQQAVRAGRDDLVRVIDSEIDPLIKEILDYQAQNTAEMHMQLQFLSNLIREDSSDPSCVIRHSATLSMLLDRYFQDGKKNAVPASLQPCVPENDEFMQDDELRPLGEDIVENLPDRVAVITTDYRYLYSNTVNALYLGVKPLALVGRHVREFVGDERFESDLRHRFDRCFSGHTLDYTCRIEKDGKSSLVRCWMRPLKSGSKKTVSGAIVVLQHVPESVALAD